MRDNNKLAVPAVPAYISYKTFSSFIDSLHSADPIPSRIDRSVMSSLSGSNQSHLLAALRYMGLISPAGIPTEKLMGLAKTTDDGYNKVLRRVLVDSYPFLFKGLDLRRATIQEIKERFASAGASGDTLRKCVVFFLSAAKVAEIQMSPFITAPRRTKRQQGTTLRSEPLRKPVREARHMRTTGKSPSLLVPELPEFDPTWPNEIKALWFEAFRELMKRDS